MLKLCIMILVILCGPIIVIVIMGAIKDAKQHKASRISDDDIED